MKEKWQERAREAFERFLQRSEEKLPQGSQFAEIEERMMELEQKLMEEVIQARSNAEGISPPKPPDEKRKPRV